MRDPERSRSPAGLATADASGDVGAAQGMTALIPSLDDCQPARPPEAAGRSPGQARRIVMHASLDEVRGVVVRAVSILAAKLPDATLSGLEIVLSEVLNNVVEHAYQNAGQGWVEVYLSCRDQDALVTVCDRGQPLPVSAVAQSRIVDPGQRQFDLPEGGFGWALIRMLASDIEYCRRDGENRLSFRVASRL